MLIYFFLFLIFFLMIYSFIYTFFNHVKETFWDYHDRISKRLKKYKIDFNIYGYDFNDKLILQALEKQKQELEDIMRQYVFFRFCEKISTYFILINIIVIFFISIVSVIFIHSFYLTQNIFLLILLVSLYIYYIINELKGDFIKFDVWATHIFMQQYKVFSEKGISESVVENKKKNKKFLQAFYFSFILPVSIIVLLILFKNFIFPILPEIDIYLQSYILIRWVYTIFIGIILIFSLLIFLNKFINIKLKIKIKEIKEIYSLILIYIFLSLIFTTLISVSKYII